MVSPSLTESVQETVTPQGAVVLSEFLPHVASAAIGVWVARGSRHEIAGEAGMTHFLEHMVFKGTARRSARQIAEELDAVGGIIDAGTSREHTNFYARVLAEHLPLACDMLCDMLLHSTFRDEDVRLEQGVVLDEIRAYEDEPGEVVMEQLMETLFGRDPIARPVLGDKEVIRGTGHDVVRGYRDRYYSSDRILISAAGQVDHAQLVELMGPLLGGLPRTALPANAPAPQARSRFRVTIREQEQAHLTLAAPALPFGHPDRFVLAALNNVLGGSASSRLFQEVREQRGLAYGAASWAEAYRDVGLVGVHTAMDPAKFREAAAVVGDILRDLAGGGVTDQEALRAREQMKAGLFLGLESTYNRMARLATSKLYLGEVTPLKVVMRMVEEITPERVRELARRLLAPERFAVAVLGPGSPEDYRVDWVTVPAFAAV
ncbi:MAG: pitrilysin family protein [Candidatus Coatesbacteria bacterium]